MIIDFSGFTYFQYLAARMVMPSGTDKVTTTPALVKTSTHVPANPGTFFFDIPAEPEWSVGVWALANSEDPIEMRLNLFDASDVLVGECALGPDYWTAYLIDNGASGISPLEYETVWKLWQFRLHYGGGIVTDPDVWDGTGASYTAIADTVPAVGFEHGAPQGAVNGYYLLDDIPLHGKMGVPEYRIVDFSSGEIRRLRPFANYPSDHLHYLLPEYEGLYQFKIRVVSSSADVFIGTRVPASVLVQPYVAEGIPDYYADYASGNSIELSSSFESIYRIFSPPFFGFGHPEQDQPWTVYSTQPFEVEIAYINVSDPSYSDGALLQISGYVDGTFIGAAQAVSVVDAPVKACITTDNAMVDALVVQDTFTAGESPADIGVLALRSSVLNEWNSTGGDHLLLVGGDRFEGSGSYVGTDVNDLKEQFTLRPAQQSIDYIPAVAIRALITADEDTLIRFIMSDGTTTIYSDPQTVLRNTVNGSIGSTYQSMLYNRNPLTNAVWRHEDFHTLQIGIESIDMPAFTVFNHLILEVLGSSVKYLLTNNGSFWAM